MRTSRPSLEKYFDQNTDRLIDKWTHYFDVYERHFAPFKKSRVTVVEFGVQHGGSLQMWRRYFGPTARLIGVDIDPRCADVVADDVEFFLTDQGDRAGMHALAERIGHVDIVIEDGGHTMTQQINTFEEFWPRVAEGGVYLVEDLHTSYWERFGGGVKRADTFIEFAKDIIDTQHAWYSEDPERLAVSDLTRTVGGTHVYDSIIVFDKAKKLPPERKITGTPSF